jgi:SsrA-binding protein
MSSTSPQPRRIVNRKAKFEYELLEHVEAGIALTGSEVKSLRSGQASLDEAFGYIRGDEIFLRDCNIAPYPQAGYAQHAPKRERKLLLHRREIRKWAAKVTERGLTLIPLSLYFNERGIAKVDLGLCKGKTHGDKRSTIKDREQKREMERAMRRR